MLDKIVSENYENLKFIPFGTNKNILIQTPI